MKTYSSIIKEKLFKDYNYQKEFLDNPKFYDSELPVLLGVDTGGGKSWMSIMMLDIFYSNKKNKGIKTIVFPHGTNVIRDNITI